MTEKIFISKLKEAHQLRIQYHQIQAKRDALRGTLKTLQKVSDINSVQSQICDFEEEAHSLDEKFHFDVEHLLHLFFDKPK
jgi:uncharacterized protein YfcZ (UPF0381/DUF406 family)